MEAAPTQTRARLAAAAAANPTDVAALMSYAEFLDKHSDPNAQEVYSRALAVLEESGNWVRAEEVARRLARLQLLAGDREAAFQSLAHRGSSASRTVEFSGPGRQSLPTVNIPGPLRSFARMAAISTEGSPEDLLPTLARNIIVNGFQASSGSDTLVQTEYLKLINRYLAQARDLEFLAGKDQVIRIESCESPEAGDLLRILGYRLRGACGSEVVLETVNASRAFVTTDSGFPVQVLEQSLRTGHPFEYPFAPTPIPVLFGPEYWIQGQKKAPEFIDTITSDPSLCRLYIGFSMMDPETAETLRKAIPFQRLKTYAHVLDFFGEMFEIRDGKAVTPGGARSQSAWAELAGSPPAQGPAFFEKLLTKDDGWLASLYDTLARLRGPLAQYMTEPARMKRFYASIHGRITSPGPARPVFRSHTGMVLLTSRIRMGANGAPRIPGGLEIWKNLFTLRPQNKREKLARQPAAWKNEDDLLEALFGLSRNVVSDNQLLQIFMITSDIDRDRPSPLLPATVARLARDFPKYGNQYAVFSESRTLPDAAIVRYLDTVEAISRQKGQLLRADTAGLFQSLIGLWQILVRQSMLPADRAVTPFSRIAVDFAGVRDNATLFDAARSGITLLLDAAAPVRGGSADSQERLINLLAGPAASGDSNAWQHARREIVRTLDAQRVTPLDTLFSFANLLEAAARGQSTDKALMNRLAAQISEVELPRATLTAVERNVQTGGDWIDRRIEAQRKLNLRAALAKAAQDPEKLEEIRESLAPLLRDTLVAFNYAYYAPPGAQILFTNPLFVRRHDFLGMSPRDLWKSTGVSSPGWPSNAGGRLTNSLSSLPYALASAEQDFLVPVRGQALIWSDLAPQMLLSAKALRWWNVTPAQSHWVGLHLAYGRELLAESALDPKARGQVLEELGALASPKRVFEIGTLLEQGQVKEAAEAVTPSELFWLARTLSPSRKDDSCILSELKSLAASKPAEVNYQAISRAFGTPKPYLTTSYTPELLNVRTFPALMGYSSRIMAESWESNILYWAALADELHLPPAELNVRIPEWTQKLVERIFASNLEDWPAVLRSLYSVGEGERAQVRAAAQPDRRAGLEEFTTR